MKSKSPLLWANWLQTNNLSLQRVLATLCVLIDLSKPLSHLTPRFGAAVAAATYSFFSEDAVFLAVIGFIFSLPCFYFAVVKPQYLSASRFVLLTYNLTCLYWYVFSDWHADSFLNNIHLHFQLQSSWKRCLRVWCGDLPGTCRYRWRPVDYIYFKILVARRGSARAQ